jgi:DnaJ-class molecular chaperone
MTTPTITVLTHGHLTTCTPYCGVVHCACGRLAMHGRKVCSVCAPVIVDCDQCDDMRSCRNHPDRKVKCGRCAGTGEFITRVENGKPTGPGGKCYRCNGKGHHTQDDRKRNNGYERFGRRY